MATLADEFLNDLNFADLGEVKGEEDGLPPAPTSALTALLPSGLPVKTEAESKFIPELEMKAYNVTQVSQLLHSNRLNEIMESIAKYANVVKSSFSDTDPEYDLVVRCNEIIVDITQDVNNIHKFIRDIYTKRFPELEALVLHPLDYARTVLTLKNDLSANSVQNLSVILPAANVITISMTASSSTGKDLTVEELERAIEAANTSIELDNSKKTILSYVEGRMQIFAPNLSALVGSEIAAKLIGAAGGLSNLANMPSTTLFVLGKKRAALDGFSRSTAVKHQGFIRDCELIRRTPLDLEEKACRVLANKATLLARIDLQHNASTDGSMGYKMKEEVEEKIRKWQEPPPLRKVKVLARPDANQFKTKRGGEKLRRHKEKFQVSEMRKRAGRIQFGKVQEEYGNSMKTLGALDMEGSGVIRANVQEKGFKIKAKKWGKKGQSEEGPGFATSVFAMNSTVGMELVDPHAHVERQEEEAQSYFAPSSGFLSVRK